MHRPGTSGSGASRPGTAMSAEGWGFGGDSLQDSLFWKKNRVKETRAGLADRGDSADGGGSKLTIGAGTLVGNPAKLLSRRKKEAPVDAVDAVGIEDDSDGAGEKDTILAQLRKRRVCAAHCREAASRHLEHDSPVGGDRCTHDVIRSDKFFLA